MLDVVPVLGLPYKTPAENDKRVVLATREGKSSIWWPVSVQKAIPDWGPNEMMRLEGVVTYKGVRCQIIAWYRVGSVDEKLGTMQLHAPDSEEP